MTREKVGAAVMAVGLLALPGACSSDPEPPAPDGEIRWLGVCAQDSDCARGRCLCNLCTETCRGDGECAAGDTVAACFDTASPGLASRCDPADLESGPGLCLAVCEERQDCPGGGADCFINACVAPAGPGEDAAARDTSERPPLPSGNDYAHVEPAVDFSEPVELPEPRTAIRGGARWLEGTWIQLTEDGRFCTPALPASGSDGLTCMQMEIELSPTGELVGHIQWLRSAGYSGPSGPFAPPIDPEAGYPVELGGDEYRTLLSRAAPEVRYRVLDAVVDGDRLSFWASAADIWTEWCRLQTPYPFGLDGRSRYRCVPGDASEASTDADKLALCTSLLDWGFCEDDSLGPIPCACMQDGKTDLSLPLCTRAACECTATRCGPNLRDASLLFQLDRTGEALRAYQVDRSGETLRGTFESVGGGMTTLDLGKVAP